MVKLFVQYLFYKYFCLLHQKQNPTFVSFFLKGLRKLGKKKRDALAFDNIYFEMGK